MEKYKNYKIYWGAVAFLAVSLAGPVVAQDTDLGETMIQLAYSLDTFYFLMSGALVMWMAAGFTMLESGLVRAKNTVEILTKNVALYSIACIMYMIVGYNIMYGDGVNGLIPGLSFFLGADNTVDEVLKSGGDTYYSNMSDFFFQVVFFATAMSIVSGAVAERMKLWSFLLFAVVMTGASGCSLYQSRRVHCSPINWYRVNFFLVFCDQFYCMAYYKGRHGYSRNGRGRTGRCRCCRVWSCGIPGIYKRLIKESGCEKNRSNHQALQA